MPSDADIVSDALVLLGDSPILSLDDTSDRASACKQLYPRVREAVLRAHPWKFAQKRVALAQTLTPPAFGYAFSYQLPVDFLRLVEFWAEDSSGSIVMSSDTWGSVLTNFRFTREGQQILTDSASCSIRYVAKVTDPNLFDSLFVSALSARMAAELAQPITSNATLMQTMLKLYEAKIQEARTVDSQEQTPDQLVSDVLTRVR
jgi:hypothetical protein